MSYSTKGWSVFLNSGSLLVQRADYALSPEEAESAILFDQLPSTSTGTEPFLLFFRKCHHRLSLVRNIPVLGFGKANVDVNTVPFAYATNGFGSLSRSYLNRYSRTRRSYVARASLEIESIHRGQRSRQVEKDNELKQPVLTASTRAGVLVFLCMLRHRLCQWRCATRGFGKNVGDVNTTTFADATDSYFSDFRTVATDFKRHSQDTFTEKNTPR